MVDLTVNPKFVTKNRGRGSRFITRPARVNVTGVGARVGNVAGHVVNISLTGALVRIPIGLVIGSEHPLTLEITEQPVGLTARIVRVQSVPIELSGAVLQREEYALGVVFSRTPAEAVEAITQLCGGLQLEDVPYRVLVIGDDEASNERVREALTYGGYVARVVSDPRSVASIAKATRADAVVLTLKFDREPSLWWVVEALSSDAATAGLRIVACVDSASLQPDRQRYLRERRVHVAEIPTIPESLLAELDRAMSEER